MYNPAHSMSRPGASQPGDYRTATVKALAGAVCDIEIDGALYAAAIATHILSVVAGQRVAVLDGGADAGFLVVAAWPMPDAAVAVPLNFDAATGTLHIQAARLNLSALATIELSCGEARIRLTLDGKAHIEGAEVLSAAIGSNRIEGASIDLN
ncbi:hypothetical protein RBA41_33090 [Massilia sp. CCM 9210]|uniref:hypothetical protein n=1 Tax=Massilia scottii TaxID=3057166 RepID=UPI00279643AC|nr:hypothetical protein [Massilia sp. CCM 9210]MDQ1818146.1 hypothetical protein [Massilia sp. CCM 9210]